MTSAGCPGQGCACPGKPLVALDAKTGAVRWDVTVADNKTGHSITVAPLAVKDKIIIRGAAIKPSKPDEFDQFVRSEVAKITKVMQAGGVKVQ